MRVALVGAQSTGKTTVLKALETEIKDARFFKETTRTVKSRNLPINEFGTEETQSAILDLHVQNITESDCGVNIMDRCILDWFVYTTYLSRDHQDGHHISPQYLEFAEKQFLKYIKHYDVIFYFSPLAVIDDDGVRSVNTQFQKEIVDIFEDVILKYNISVVRLNDNHADRVANIVSKVNELRSNNE